MTSEETHFDAYAKLNDSLLGLIMSGKGESSEADDVRLVMDIHWGIIRWNRN